MVLRTGGHRQIPVHLHYRKVVKQDRIAAVHSRSTRRYQLQFFDIFCVCVSLSVDGSIVFVNADAVVDVSPKLHKTGNGISLACQRQDMSFRSSPSHLPGSPVRIIYTPLLCIQFAYERVCDRAAL